MSTVGVIFPISILGVVLAVAASAAHLAKGRRFKLFAGGVLASWLVGSLLITVLDRWSRPSDLGVIVWTLALPALVYCLVPGLLVWTGRRPTIVVAATIMVSFLSALATIFWMPFVDCFVLQNHCH
jgi:hypothetical protein